MSYDIKKVKFNPYVISSIDVILDLPPSKLNNNIYNNLFNEASKLEGLCYKDYGYIQEVQKILYYDQGILMNENNNGDVRYHLSLQCKICHPFIGDTIIAKIDTISDIIIILTCGPIKLFLKNNDILISDKSQIEIGRYAIIKLTNIKLTHKEFYIIALGQMLDVITDDNIIKEMFEKIYQE